MSLEMNYRRQDITLGHLELHEETIESLERENAQLRAVIAEQNTVISMLQWLVTEQKETIHTCDELSRLSREYRDKQAELIETLAEAIERSVCVQQPEENHYLCRALAAYEEWKK